MPSWSRGSALALIALAGLACAACSDRRGPEAPPSAASAEAQPTEEALSAFNVGVRQLEQLQPGEAAQRFERALALTPRWLPALVNLAIARLNVLDPAADEAAAAAATQALSVNPADARAKYVLAYVRAERQRRFEDALPLLREVVQAEPQDASAWYQLARAAAETADSGDAATGSASATDDAAALRSEAEAAYRKALAIDPGFAEANYKLARLLLESEDAARQAEGEAALARHEELLKGRPAVQQNYFQRGALALAYPFTPERPPAPAPGIVTWRAEPGLQVPEFPRQRAEAGLSPLRYRDGLTVADVDGDGRLDILAPMRGVEQPAVLAWAQQGDGSFAAARAFGPQGRACSSAPAGDLDRDGDVDLVVSTNAGNLVLENLGAGMFGLAARPDMDWPAVAGLASTLVDFDHDGDLDLHVIEPLSERTAPDTAELSWRATQFLWRNDGAGNFIPVTGTVGLNFDLDSHAIAWADFDGDNAVDLIASVAGRGPCVARNDRSEKFTLVNIAPPLPQGRVGPPAFLMAVLDADRDDDADLVLSSQGELTLWRNESRPGQVSFAASAPVPLPADMAHGALLVADADLDGVPELLLFGAAGSPRLVSFPVGTASVAVPVRPVPAEGLDAQVAVAADLDGDGDVDLVARKSGSSPVVLRNELAKGASWVAVLPAGREGRSNAQGLGAKIAVDAGTLHARIERASVGAPLCHSLAPVTFGLGARTAFDGLSVTWPSGIRQAEIDVPAGELRRVEELDRQPSSCPMLYGWDGERFAFLTDCFDTSPLGLWVAMGVHVEGDPDEFLRLRPGWVEPVEGVLNLSVAEFLNESLLADRVGLLAIDASPGESVVVDEAVRLTRDTPDLDAWRVSEPLPVRARVDDADQTAALAAVDHVVAGWTKPLRWTGLAQAHALTLDVPAGARVLVLTGSLNFPNSSALFGASQAGVGPMPPRLEVFERGRWKELSPDCGAPAGFGKDVVIDLEVLRGRAARLRVTTNLQVSWDAAIAHASATRVSASEAREVPLLRAEKQRMAIPAEVQGTQNRWRSFPRDAVDPKPWWLPQGGTVTPDGDVAPLLGSSDRGVAVVRPGEEIVLGFDDAALPLAAGRARTHVLVTRGWVKDRDPHTLGGESVDPVPGAKP